MTHPYSIVFPEAAVRTKDLQYIANCLRRGRCCAVVAPSNTGKSLLLRSLPLEAVRCACTREGNEPPVMVFIDLMTQAISEQALYELLLTRTLEELHHVHGETAQLSRLELEHQKLLSASSDLIARSLFANAMHELSHDAALSLVLILDEFDEVFQSLPPWPFRQLRAVRDSFGERLCYVTATSRHLKRLRADEATYEFRELFLLHTLVLRPLDGADAQTLAQHLTHEGKVTWRDDQISAMIQLSGGHPGLLEAIFECLLSMPWDAPRPLSSIQEALSQLEPIQEECLRLWSELEEEEKRGLLILASGHARDLDLEGQRALEVKGLIVTGDGGAPTVFSPLFAAFISAQEQHPPMPAACGLRYDPETGGIWMDQREITLELSGPQRALLRFLCQRAGKVCTHYEIATEIWGIAGVEHGVSPGAIYELVKRVRQHVERDWRHPEYIVTVPGEGYRLQTPH